MSTKNCAFHLWHDYCETNCDTHFVYGINYTGETKMISILHDKSTSIERPFNLTRTRRDAPVKIIKRNIRREPPVQPGDEIYERARIIFSRAHRTGRSRASSIL